MKQLVCLFIYLATGFYSFGQKIKDDQFVVSKGLLSIQSGIAIPVSDFASKDLTLAAGYALPGYNIKIGLSYDVLPLLGICLQYQYIQNPFDETSLLADYKASDKNIQFNSFQSDPWKLQGMMLGFYVPLKSNKLSTDIRLLGGVLSGVLPENTTNYHSANNPSNVYNLIQQESFATNFCFQAGVLLRYQVYKNLMLVGSADFNYTEIEYENLSAVETIRNVTISLNPYTQYYHIINLSVGLGIQFN